MATASAASNVDPLDDRAIYKQVADQLRDRLDAGEFAPGARLPSETALMETFEVSRATVRKALELLTAEGRIRSVRGRGVFVTRARRLIIHDPARFLRSRVDGADRDDETQLEADAREQGFAYHTNVVGLRELPSSPLVAALLRIETGTSVFVRERIVLTKPPDGRHFEPAKIANSYLPSDVAVGRIRDVDTGRGGTYARLREHGHQLTHFDEHLIFRMPDPHEASRLRLGPGIPVIDQTRVAHAPERPVECFLAVLAGDKHAIEYRIAADHVADDAPTMPAELVSKSTTNGGRVAVGMSSDDATVDFGRDRPVYKQIADRLRERIDRGELRTGDRLPSETSLMRWFGVTRTTVRRAIAELTREGRVRTERGVGAFVKEIVLPEALTRTPYDRLARHHYLDEGKSGLTIDAESRGRSPDDVRQDRLALDEVAAPAAVAERLQVASGTPVFRRRRRMRIGTLPTQLTDSYMPLDVAVGALREEFMGDGGAHARLEELGFRLTEFIERLSVRMPSPRETHALALEPGVPVVDLYQTAYAGARPVECFVSVIAGDRYVFSYRIRA